jgi:hypothetical protein
VQDEFRRAETARQIIFRTTLDANKFSGDGLALRVATLGAKIAVLGKKLERVRDRVSQSEEDMDAVVCELADLLGALRGLVGDPVVLPRGGPTEPPGVVPVVLVAHPSASGVVQIKGRSPITLPPFLAALLEILKADDGIETDDLVCWKTMTFIQSALRERTKQNHSKAAVKELVFRLRNLLERHGENRFLVQHNHRLGYRFAVRRGSGVTTGHNNQ